MTSRLLIAAAILGVVLVVAWWLRRRRPEGPPRDTYPVPRQLDRADFARPDAAWLVAYFSSAVCDSCQGLGPKVAVLESPAVATCELDYARARGLHERYDISAIPMILLADEAGVVHRAFIGATTATDLWAAVAELRAPGSTPEPTLGELD
ncbi:MAG TPA: thioredoxin family protein [Acidimicrobiia bacterium]|nr:thioredoxin family protein [Acidimicrobiia bacterium]